MRGSAAIVRRSRWRGPARRRSSRADSSMHRRAGAGRPDAEAPGRSVDHRGGCRRDPHRRVQAVPVGGAGDLEAAVGIPPDADGVGRERGVEARGEVRRDAEPVARVRQERDRRVGPSGVEPRPTAHPDLGRRTRRRPSGAGRGGSRPRRARGASASRAAWRPDGDHARARRAAPARPLPRGPRASPRSAAGSAHSNRGQAWTLIHVARSGWKRSGNQS